VNRDAFATKIKQACPIGMVIDNSGEITTMITGYSDSHISYNRRNLTISVAFSDLYKAYTHFYGKRISTVELKEFMPLVFDSASRSSGNSNNCIFLFSLLEKMCLSGPITGAGVRGNPYSVMVSMQARK
jgi:hypothetical protein